MDPQAVRGQTFRGRDLKEALGAVKLALGEDALVVSTKQVRDGLFGRAVEILAQAEDTEAKRQPVAPANSQPRAAMAAYRARADAAAVPQADVDERLRPIESEMRRMRAQLVSLVGPSDFALADAGLPLGSVKRHNGTDGKNDTTFLVTVLLGLGLSVETARHWSARIQQSKDIVAAVEKLVWDTVELAGEVGSSGGKHIVCVGPSGAGKTTTIAKWAAHAVLKADKRIVVITLDSFRAGAAAQLGRYTELIGCELVAPKTRADLLAALDAHKDKDLIFVDTAGRDPATQQEVALVTKEILRRDRKAEVHLALPAMYGPRSLHTVIAAYRRFGVNRVCFTKVDETPDLAPLLSVLTEGRLPVSYWTTGQRIPDDLSLLSAPLLTEHLAPAIVRAIQQQRTQLLEQLV